MMMGMMRFEELLVILLQFIGISLPLYSMFILCRRGISKGSTNLLIANFGALLMNGAYLLMIRAVQADASIMAFKIKNLGSIVFSMFFVTYILQISFPDLKKKAMHNILKIWYLFEVAYFLIVFNDEWSHLAFLSTEVVINERANIRNLIFEMGPVYIIRSSILAVGILCFLIYLLVLFFKSKKRAEKGFALGISISLIFILIPIIITSIGNTEYDSRSVCVSIAGAIVSVYCTKEKTGIIRDMWRGWLIEHMSDPFILVGNGTIFVDANLSAKKIFPELESLDMGDDLPEYLGKILDESDGPIKVNDRYYKRTITNLNASSKAIGTGVLMNDISKQRELMDELDIARRRAEEANEAKTNFLSNMSHEIRTPMNAIVGMTEILQRTELNESQREYLTTIQHSGTALIAIINDILDFSKIEAGKMDIIPEKYEPMSLLSDLSMIFLTRIGNKSVELYYDIDPDMPSELYGDSLRIRQIIINIVNNAIKFTESGSVTLKVECQNLQVDSTILRFTVTDTGMGIKEEDLDKLFGSFSQVDTRKNRSKEGTGLGLAICKLLTEQMGGEIWVDSTYGKGSTFGFTIPQGVCSEKAAASVSRSVRISGYMSDPMLLDALKREAKRYGIEYVNPEETNMFNPECDLVDYFFTDEGKYEDIKPYISALKNTNMECVLLRNPLIDTAYGGNVRLVNKPLYSLSFCKIINGEKLNDLSRENKILNFIAPDARVLIVDDNETNLKVAVGLLEPLEMKIDIAISGMEAINKIQEKYNMGEPYHMVFMDHMMPVMDGVQTTEKIRSLPEDYYSQIPIIALSANAVAGARDIFTNAGMVDFVAKPIDIKEICKKIKKYMPEDLIQITDKEIFKEPGAEALDNIPEEYLNISGIDVLAGIKASGGAERWMSLLSDYCKVVELKAKRIENCLIDDLIKDYTIEVHALKSASWAIGAIELSGWFYEMEKCGNAEDRERIYEETPRLLEEYKNLKKNIIQSIHTKTEYKKNVSNDVIYDALETLKECMDGFDLDGADSKVRELEEYILPEELAARMGELSALVADVAMDEVIELCEQLQGCLD